MSRKVLVLAPDDEVWRLVFGVSKFFDLRLYAVLPRSLRHDSWIVVKSCLNVSVKSI